MTGKRVLLTGGAGFIGTALTRRLLEQNQIVVYDNGHRDSPHSQAATPASSIHCALRG